MYDPYAFESYPSAMDDTFLSLFLGIYFIVLAVTLLYAIFVYVISSVGLHTLAKRRGIHHAWLAWLPIGNCWILGCVSDQYQYVVKGRNRSRRKLLLGLNIGSFAALILCYGVYYTLFIDLMEEMIYYQDPVAILGYLGGFLLIWLVLMAISVVASVFTYIAYYDLFVSSRPKAAVAFLVLGIIFSFLLPYFVFACRKKDGGMPPRRNTTAAPVQPQRTVQPPIVPQIPVQAPIQPTAQPQFDFTGDVTADESDFEPEE